MAQKEGIQQPDDALRKKLDELYNATPEEVSVNGHNYSIGWIKNGTQRKFTNVFTKEKNPQKANCKASALILLNNKFKIFFCYWFLWRWFYYVKELDCVDTLRILDVAKKKVQHEAFLLATIFSTEMTDLMMTMTSKEVSRIQAVQHGEQHTP